MTYKEKYLKLSTKEKVKQEASTDEVIALLFDVTKIDEIRKAAQEVIAEKWGTENK